jgi:hypothetical protein
MNNKFQDGEKVLVKEWGVIETVDKWSYVPSMRRFTYTTLENPATFYFESELDLPKAPDSTAQAQAEGG